LVEQYNGYVVVDSMTINGQLTLGENIADLGGLLVSYYGLQKALEGKPKEKIDGFTPEQRYFLAFASDWRTMQRPEALKLQINTDPHSPAEFRVRGPLANLVEFQQAFGCSADAKFMRKPEEIIKIW
jgi:putative endopeptidase